MQAGGYGHVPVKSSLVVNADFIRQYFRPLQPNHSLDDSQLDYHEFTPPDVLMPYVYCFWELTSPTPASQSYQVVADGTVDIIFDLNHHEPPQLSITNDRAFVIPLQGEIHYMGIRFLPACIHYFFSLSLSGLKGLSVEAEGILGRELAVLNDRLQGDQRVEGRLEAMAEFLRSRQAKNKMEIDPRFLQSLHHVLNSSGNALVQTDVAEFISSRQLRRMFERYVGLSPKLFSRVVRFQQTLATMRETPLPEWNKVFLDYGYYDQAHFIREFKTFYGHTPGSLMADEE